MFCKKYADRGILYLYDELDPNEKQAFEAHLKICPMCQGELALLTEGKQFARMVPLEQIAPISYKEFVPSVKPVQNIVEKYIQPFWETIRPILQYKRRLVLVPMGVAFLFVMMLYMLDPQFKIFKSSLSPYSETILDWDTGMRESLDSLDQKIALLRSEKPFIAKASTEHALYPAADFFSDQHLDQIAADIQSLSNELNQFNF